MTRLLVTFTSVTGVMPDVTALVPKGCKHGLKSAGTHNLQGTQAFTVL